MQKLLFAGLLGCLLLAVGACATAAPGPAATATPKPVAKPTIAAAPAETKPTIAAAAAAKVITPIGAPGAVYAGKLEDLAGKGALGEDVALDMLQRHTWIFESDYYKSLLQKAKLDNPTPLVTKGAKFKQQYSCINRTLLPCKLVEGYFAANVLKRTEGQVEISVVGYPELAISGTDNLRLVGDGTLGFSEIYGGFVSGDLPVVEIFYLWGLYPDHKTEFKAQEAMLAEMDKIVGKAAGGGTVVTHNWYAGNDQYFYSKKPLRKLEDFKGLKTRSHGTAMSDLINGMGGSAQFVPFAEVYTALERGILDAAATGATAGYGLRFYEVSKYIVAVATSFPATFIIFNKKVWDQFPPDIQQILMEEGAKQELEGLRLAPEWNETGLPKNTKAGMEYIALSPELLEYRLNEAVLKRVVPNWVKRAGGPHSETVKLFNDKIAPIAGVQINVDGTATFLKKP